MTVESASSRPAFDPENLKFNEAGLLPAIAQDADTHEVLMLAWMNAESLRKTLATGQVTYWSRSRQSFWVKGETSGHTQDLVSLRFDCDRDSILILVRQKGAACHTGRKTCFYREVSDGCEVDLMSPIDNGSP